MNVGAVALLGGGALLIHASLTAQSPLADLQSIFTSGKVSSISGALNPITANKNTLIQGTPGAGGSAGGSPSGPDPLTYTGPTGTTGHGLAGLTQGMVH
ncbi:MAG TPA: hypothetical protein VN375_19180 [Vicinamibacteria bacterium]|jgi:hypothetical protein|nr:hypothetical protein [Vicinamibacteria bacterium]